MTDMGPHAAARRPPSGDQVVAIVAFPGVTLLDVAGPLQVLARLGRPYSTVLVAQRPGLVATDTPAPLTATAAFETVDRAAAVVVPGGGLGVVRAMVDPAVAGFIGTVAARAPVVGAVCTGSLLLAAAGLLAGRRATTHWGYAPILARLGADYRDEAVVTDGAFVTAASGAAGIAMALDVAARLAGPSERDRIAMALAVEPAPGAPAARRRGAPGSLLAHLPRAEATARLASMRLILSERPELLQRLEL